MWSANARDDPNRWKVVLVNVPTSTSKKKRHVVPRGNVLEIFFGIRLSFARLWFSSVIVKGTVGDILGGGLDGQGDLCNIHRDDSTH
jgi:hypothetical protein